MAHLALAPATLPAATVYTAYTQAITASGGTGPYTYAVTAGALPTGLSLSSGGVLSGIINTASQTGTFNVTITATGQAGLTGSATYSLVINPPVISLSPASLPNPTAGATYSQSVTATGGVAPYTFALASGALPSGLALSTAGVISGSTTAPGIFNFTVRATDTNGYTGTGSYSITVISPTITISPASLPTAFTGIAYSQALSSSGGAAPYSYAVTSGSLPVGITLSSAGVLAGSATAAGTFTFTVTSTDRNSFTGTRSYTLTVVPKLGATLLASNGTSPCTSAASCSVTIPATTNGATELIVVEINDSITTGASSILSVTGPLSGATAIASRRFSQLTPEAAIFAWRATGNGLAGKVTVNYSTNNQAGVIKVVVSVIQLSGNSTSSVVAQSTINAGTASPATSTFSTAPNAANGEIVIVGTALNSTLPTMGLIDSGAGTGYGYGVYLFNPAAITQSFALGTSGKWGTIGIEINHG